MSLEFAQQITRLYPDDWRGYCLVAQDLIALKHFRDLIKFCETTKYVAPFRYHNTINDWIRTSDAGISALSDMSTNNAPARVCEFSRGRTIILPIGDFCFGAQLVEDSGGRMKSLPFDWVFTTPKIIQRILNSGFDDFIQIEYLQSQHPKRQCGHSLYKNTDFFNHHDPSREPDRSAFQRRIERFKDLLLNQDGEILFFHVGLFSRADDLKNLHEKLPVNSKILSFVFHTNGIHDKPVEKLIESKILEITFKCDTTNTNFAKNTSLPNKFTDGRFIYCPYSRTYALSLLQALRRSAQKATRTVHQLRENALTDLS
jgi:hypothetical protein